MQSFKSPLVAAIFLALSWGTNAIKINSVSYSGEGCPQNSLSTQITSKGDIATVIFDAFGVDTSDLRTASCDLKVTLGGSGSATLSADIRGYALLSNGLMANISASLGVNSQRQRQLSEPRAFTSPMSDDYVWSLQAAIATGSSSFDWTTMLLLSNGSDASGRVTVDSIDISIQ